MSDSYDPLSTQTTAITFRRLDALQDTVSAYGRTSANAPVPLLVAADGTLQTRRLARLTDEIVLIATDDQGTARPVLVDAFGRFLLAGVPVNFLAPGGLQVQGKADPDGTVNVHDPGSRSTLANILTAIQATQPRSVTNWPADFPDILAQARLASILAQLDAPTSAVRDGIVTAIQATQARSVSNFPTDYPDALAQARLASILTAIQATQPRSVTNFPADYPDALAASRLLSILGQLDITQSALRDAITGPGGTSNKGLFDVWVSVDAIRLAQNRNASEIWDVKSAQGVASNGLTVTLDLGVTGRPHVQRFVSTTGPATVLTQVSRDGVTWRTLETQSFAVASSGVETLPTIGYRYVRVTSANVGPILEFEISASR